MVKEAASSSPAMEEEDRAAAEVTSLCSDQPAVA